ncbi:hypothetical protein NHX12_011525 [Muraenolepis orangiensis]|uniref:TRIM8/14/16/25/29/45/65 coiled-coil region domain-containing protein n=1 Tax=Muraenolepis orangiensis TaxID=630683 RepID=A0A9Q0DJ25_9TELE|nr:hypothetical protein NHX12_011525 [Muraenolepis orangiensis]
MTTGMKYIKRSLAELIVVVDEKQSAAEAQAQSFGQEIQEEIVQLRQRNTELQQLHTSEDCLQFFQSVTSVAIVTPSLTKDWDKDSIDCDHSKLEEAVDQLQVSVMEKWMCCVILSCQKCSGAA